MTLFLGHCCGNPASSVPSWLDPGFEGVYTWGKPGLGEEIAYIGSPGGDIGLNSQNEFEQIKVGNFGSWKFWDQF